ncbi:hypothetical protein K1719_044487 [Acacia pycnantha]|nr:hypothetical protein K1719_044487 [Acacia pycnantha]
MENSTIHEIAEHHGLTEVPSLANHISSNDQVAEFYSIENAADLQFPTPSPENIERPMLKRHGYTEEIEGRVNFGQSPLISGNKFKSFKTFSGRFERQISIFRGQSSKQGVSKQDNSLNNTDSIGNAAELQFHFPYVKDAERPIVKGHGIPEETEGTASSGQNPPINGAVLKDRSDRYDSFKTFSARHEGQKSIFHGKSTKQGNVQQQDNSSNNTHRPRTVDRYYDALEGPELETLRPSEETIIPQDEKWPFLLRFPISSFGMCLGISSQAILWKILAISPSTKFLHISKTVNLVLWIISVALVASSLITYLVKIIIYFEAVRREYYHPIRVNFFFAPWITLLLLGVAIPPSLDKYLHHALWYILIVPIFLLELKIYGQWISGGQRRLSKVANPLNHLSIAGNFVGALLGASMGLKEGPLFFFAVGLAHYLVLFVTLYQRLPTAKTLPKELHPVFFLFVAGPSLVCLSWSRIRGSFDYIAKIAFYVGIFLYLALSLLLQAYSGFSLAWWAYTFPMTCAAIAAIMYSNEVTTGFTKTLSVGLSFISSLIVIALFVSTIIHAFVLRDLFPNDNAIAISDRKRITNNWLFPGVSEEHSKAIETYLKFANPDGGNGDGDLEAAVEKPSNPAEKH